MDLKGLSALAGGFNEKKTAEMRWNKCKDCAFLTKKTNRSRGRRDGGSSMATLTPGVPNARSEN